jgi:hypothetical protein
VRNLVRHEGSSFFLQKADGCFYPDFLCQLSDANGQAGVVIALEYKGADRWGNADDYHLIGSLWVNLSDGRFRFVMVTEKQGGLRRSRFEAAQRRDRKLCSIDKINARETTRLWRDVMNELATKYLEVELSRMPVDNARHATGALPVIRRRS